MLEELLGLISAGPGFTLIKSRDFEPDEPRLVRSLLQSDFFLSDSKPVFCRTSRNIFFRSRNLVHRVRVVKFGLSSDEASKDEIKEEASKISLLDFKTVLV